MFLQVSAYIFIFCTRIGHPVTMTTPPRLDLSLTVIDLSTNWTDALFSEFSTDFLNVGIFLGLDLHLLHSDSHPVTVTITLKYRD